MADDDFLEEIQAEEVYEFEEEFGVILHLLSPMDGVQGSVCFAEEKDIAPEFSPSF